MTARDWRYWRNLITFALTILALGGIFVILFFSYQGAHSYTHPKRFERQADDTPALFGISYEDKTITTADNLELSAWYTPTQNGALILVAHGYAGGRSPAMHSLFARHGYGVISWDARAHGESAGERCTFGYEEKMDVQAVLNFALALDDVEKVGAFGESMGAVTLIGATADQPQISALVSDSAFAAIEDMIARVVPHPIFAPFIQFFVERQTELTVDDLRPVNSIQQISPRPVFIIQGDSDLTVPSSSARRLYEASGEPRTLWIEAGVGHVGTYYAMPEEYEQRVIDFFAEYLLEEVQ